MPDDDRALAREDLAAMLRAVRPDWRLRGADLAAGGRASVYHLDVDADGERRACVLKSAPADAEGFDVGTEARIQAVVDAHDDLRAPFFLMEALDGDTLSRSEGGDMDDDALRRVARQTGRYLAELHELDVGVTAYGADLAYEGARTRRGGSPACDPGRLVGEGGHRRWGDQLREWFQGDFELLADSRFADMAPALRRTLARQVDALPADPDPVFARVDHHWENLVVDRETGAMAGVIDWGETTAYPRALSLALVEYFLARDWWMVLPEAPGRRPLVRAGLLAGYREAASVPETYEPERRCYQLSMLVRELGLFEQRVVESEAIPDERTEEAAAHLRATVAAEVDDEGA